MNAEKFLGNIELFKCNLFQADTQNINNEINSKVNYINNENIILQNFKVEKPKKFFCRFCKNHIKNSKNEISKIPRPPNKPRTMKIKFRNKKKQYSLTVNSTESQKEHSSLSSASKLSNNNPKIYPKKRKSVVLGNFGKLKIHSILKDNISQNSISIITDYLNKMPDDSNESNNYSSSCTPSKSNTISKTRSRNSSENTSQEKNYSYFNGNNKYNSNNSIPIIYQNLENYQIKKPTSNSLYKHLDKTLSQAITISKDIKEYQNKKALKKRRSKSFFVKENDNFSYLKTEKMKNKFFIYKEMHFISLNENDIFNKDKTISKLNDESIYKNKQLVSKKYGVQFKFNKDGTVTTNECNQELMDHIEKNKKHHKFLEKFIQKIDSNELKSSLYYNYYLKNK